VEAFGKDGDVLLAINTSGNSRNVAREAEQARIMGMKVIGLTAEGETLLKRLSDVCLCAPRTPHSDRIQELHIKVIHIVIEALEKVLFQN
jgi:D-sedoheptulose 7-phosphate isomerase